MNNIPKIRRSPSRTITLRQDQIEYIKDHLADLRDFSRWMRGAVDLRIRFETGDVGDASELRKLMYGSDFNSAFFTKRAGDTGDTSDNGDAGADNDGTAVEGE